METKNMIYIVSEYASKGEIFGKWSKLFILSFFINRFADYKYIFWERKELFQYSLDAN